MLNAFPKAKSFGFSLIELMVGIVIMIVLAALAMPSFQTMLRNSEIRNAAESIANGLQRARAEAVARNANVEFVLGAYPTCTAAGSSWIVDYEIKPVPADPPIDSRCSSEGSKNVTVAALAVDLATPATTIIFNSLGQPKVGVAANVQLAQVDVAAAGGDQNFRVAIGLGGNAKMCDPSLPAGSSPRAC